MSGQRNKHCFDCLYHREMGRCLRDFAIEDKYSSREPIYDCNVERSIGGCGEDGIFWKPIWWGCLR